MRIQTKVVWLWTCLSAFTFIHTAAAQDYSADPFSQPPADPGVAAADYSGEDPSLDGSQPDTSAGGGLLDRTAYQGVYPDGPGAGYDGGMSYGDPSVQAYPPPIAAPPGTGYWPQTSPYDTRVRDRTYRENGIWVNDSVYGDRRYLFSVEYLRVFFNRPGTDTIGAGNVGPDPILGGPVNASVFSQGGDLTSDGIQGKFIIQNADSTTFEARGWWTAEGDSVYEPLGRGNSGNANTFAPRGVITYNDGTAIGRAVRYDTDFKLGYKEQAFGGDLTWSTMPFFETEGFKLRALFGGKYVKVREQFTFHGEDSALNYIPSSTGGTGSTIFLPNPFGNPNFASDMTSRTTSDFAGLEAGVRYEFGGKHFLLWGQSRGALTVNHENINLYGNNMGDGYTDGFPTPTPGTPKTAFFNHTQSHTHLSPMFSQDFNFQAKVFQAIPFLNDIPMLANADMLVGYNFLLIGNVARPTKDIVYNLDDPKLSVTHSRWCIQTWNFGLQWKF
ncbi:MAG: hypothetical protein JWM11_7465 [Planctomycetaceae bacterium]|nr:hypothetical protein [Planctomycetaceae bacterium]